MEHHPISAEQFVKPVDDYLRVMTATNEISIADVPANVDSILAFYEQAKTEQAELLVLPELSLTGYSTADLFFNQHVRERTVEGLQELATATAEGPAMAVGLPLEHNGRLYNCAALLAEGQIKGIVPKSYIPNYNEFYENRWFSSGRGLRGQEIRVGQQLIPFGVDVHFDVNGTRVGMEICEDAWAAISPSTVGGLNGAEVYLNLSASDEIIGKDDYRRRMLGAMAGKVLQGYAYSSAGAGESNADVVYGGAQLIAENGRLVAERKPLDDTTSYLVYDFDRTYLEHDRLQNKTFADQAGEYMTDYRVVPVSVPQPSDESLRREVKVQYVPEAPEALAERCEQIIGLAAHALAQRVVDARSENLVLGLSGGLDSLLGLFISLEAAKLLGRPPSMIHTITMPGFASSARTQDNATEIAKALGTTHSIMPISELSSAQLRLIGHDGTTEDIAYENTQARLRTNVLMNYGNLNHGFVQGTGDMSEITQGYCTFNGDQMSMYNPNCGIPKTLARPLTQWYVANRLPAEAKRWGQDIVDTPFAAELKTNQVTEDAIGPYELHDFFDYHNERYGSRPTKIGYLAKLAFEGMYDDKTIAHWLGSFLYRDTVNQWKIEASPNGPKIGSVAKSPRGDRRRAPNTSVRWME